MARLHAVYGERFAAAGGRLELAGSPVVPRADPHLLERILANLVDNALTYRRPDVPPLVAVSVVGHGERVTVSVADNGIGIPPEHRERIFALFTRLHREDEYPGTGIGLSIVRKAARLMGSDVTVASVVGEGSTFSLELPAAAG
ncbi:MAG TPA: ATP-binding protein [Candidatus Limnocylindrales bacterium]